MKPPIRPCLVCGRPGAPVAMQAPGNVSVVVVTICAECAVDRFVVAECLRRVGVK